MSQGKVAKQRGKGTSERATAKRASSRPKPGATAAKAMVGGSSETWLLPGETIQLKDEREEKGATNEELNSRYVTGEDQTCQSSARCSDGPAGQRLPHRPPAARQRGVRDRSVRGFREVRRGSCVVADQAGGRVGRIR